MMMNFLLYSWKNEVCLNFFKLKEGNYYLYIWLCPCGAAAGVIFFLYTTSLHFQNVGVGFFAGRSRRSSGSPKEKEGFLPKSSNFGAFFFQFFGFFPTLSPAQNQHFFYLANGKRQGNG